MTTDSLQELGERIRLLARVPTLLVACDYDGTIAPVTSDPMQASPSRDAVAAMRRLAELANTHVSVISGRSLRDLATLSRLPEEIRLVGSHGSEFDLGFSADLPADLAALRQRLTEASRAIGGRFGALVEEKPTGVTFHLRQLDDESHQLAREALVRGPAGWDGIYTRNGHQIVEMSVLETNKGWALDSIRQQVGASAVIFMGDDVTDEDALRTLRGPDVGVKVGDGTTAAPFRVRGPGNVAQILALLSDLRGEWLQGAGLIPITSHSMLSDQRTTAIVSPTARISWMCVPRIDSSAVFAELVGGPSAGYFAVSPGNGDAPTSQQYKEASLILETRFPTVTVTDYLDVSADRSTRIAGRTDLLRIIEGTGDVTIEFAPRVDFGRVATRLDVQKGGVIVQGTADQLALRSPDVTWTITGDGPNETAIGHANLDERNGEPLILELRSGTATLRDDGIDEQTRRAQSEQHWASWAAELQLDQIDPAHHRLIVQSALALKGLTHGPTGAIVASATTSLPAHIGGVRNFDHRYCWLRTAAMSADALVTLGSNAEAISFLHWIDRVLETRTDPERLAPLYNVTGRHLPPEAEIGGLAGYGGSRPVRIGNAADGQVQLDVFGSIIGLIDRLANAGAQLDDRLWRLTEQMALAVSRRWAEPDHGIWEQRVAPRHNTYSKIMCWVALDRAIGLSRRHRGHEPAAWVSLRDDIAERVIAGAWSKRLGTFTATLGGDELDVAVLNIGLRGLVAVDDPRFLSTISTIERDLFDGQTARRYLADDGLPGGEDGFHLATGWLIETFSAVGRHDDAVDLFDKLRAAVGPTGLLSEQYDPEHKRGLGNFPAASAHTALINSAACLESARS